MPLPIHVPAGRVVPADGGRVTAPPPPPSASTRRPAQPLPAACASRRAAAPPAPSHPALAAVCGLVLSLGAVAGPLTPSPARAAVAEAVVEAAAAVASATTPAAAATPPPQPQGAVLAAAQAAQAATKKAARTIRAPFLSATGARGLLVEEETRLYELRLRAEGEVAAELDRARLDLETESRAPGASVKLCATPFGIDVVGITELLALVGALVGGISARARKAEVERLNDQLRKINLSLRQQARAGTVYAPGLTYAPQPLAPGGSGGGGGGGVGGGGVAVAEAVAAVAVAAPPPPPAQPAPAAAAPAAQSIMSTDEEDMSPEMKQCVASLRDGKRLLKARDGGPAMVRFEKALMLAESMEDTLHEKRAVRGLAAAARLIGERRAAIGHLERVLGISRATGDCVGDADACGTIADLYTELGQFEKAAEWYDRYISRMATDGPV